MDDKVMEIRAIRVGLARLLKVKAELQAELVELAGKAGILKNERSEASSQNNTNSL